MPCPRGGPCDRRSRRAPGSESSPSTSRISVRAVRAFSSMRSSAAGVSAAPGSRAAPDACTTSAPMCWTSPATTLGVEPVAFFELGGAHLGCPLLGAHCREPSQLAHLVAASGHQRTAQRRTADEHGEEEQVVGDGVGARIGHLARQSEQTGVDHTPQRRRDRTQPGAGRKTCSDRHEDRRRGVHEVRADREVEERSAGGHRQQRDRCQRPARDSHLGHGTRVGRARITGHHSREGRPVCLRRSILKP